jgi:hypothetical protein
MSSSRLLTTSSNANAPSSATHAVAEELLREKTAFRGQGDAGNAPRLGRGCYIGFQGRRNSH